MLFVERCVGPCLAYQAQGERFADERDQQTEQMRCERDRRIRGYHLHTFQAAIWPKFDALQRRRLSARQSQRPPNERCEAVSSGQCGQLNSQRINQSYSFLRMRIGGGLVRRQDLLDQVAN